MTTRADVPQRRLVITICANEPGVVVLPVEPGGPRRRLNARAILRELRALVERRRLADIVDVREGCAGGCHGRGPNVSLTIHARPAPGERPDHVAIGWRTYVGSLADAPALLTIVDENLG